MTNVCDHGDNNIILLWTITLTVLKVLYAIMASNCVVFCVCNQYADIEWY